ncbi:phospholipase D-like domain-containing protein [Planktothrix sp. FACHB-1365]|uniref:phospholipase D-like domain-containing protein n=1 Tax=Planktothrix sp. FACHB-1365 TaxID=2692855 RepID=UPI001689BB68|nr:phospholipase D-like domain-containing protein [Planktothrix sp. FACHB-1365]MBD2481176.1 hypothetical protein [Planktothrix sp. FACHB-1365]
MFLPNSYDYSNLPNRKTPDLDLRSFSQFDTRLAHCQKCLAIQPNLQRNQQKQIFCPTCGIQYIVNSPEPAKVIQTYFRDKNLYFNDNNLDIEHLKQLGAIAQRLNTDPDYPLMAGLLKAMSLAKKFIHFTSLGISHQFLGALKLTSQQIPVKGIVSLTSSQTYLLPELSNYTHESPKLEIKPMCETIFNWDIIPHQKLIVIDGLIAFKGSANLTVTAWRKAERNLEEIEVITNMDEVIYLHNRYFSTVWADFSSDGKAIMIDYDNLEDMAA